jgi:hypothetical protein
MEERRKFDRVRLPASAGVYALDEDGKRLGRVLKIGAGGLVLETAAQLAEGSPHHIVLVEESEHIRRPLVVVFRFRSPEGIVLEFRAVDIEAAIDIGIIIGKYSSQVQAAACA